MRLEREVRKILNEDNPIPTFLNERIKIINQV